MRKTLKHIGLDRIHIKKLVFSTFVIFALVGGFIFTNDVYAYTRTPSGNIIVVGAQLQFNFSAEMSACAGHINFGIGDNPSPNANNYVFTDVYGGDPNKNFTPSIVGAHYSQYNCSPGGETIGLETWQVLTEIDTTAPIGSIAINSEATYTTSGNVTLNFSNVSSDVTQIKLGNGTSGSYQTAIAYENPHAYTLPDNGDGTYAVRVRFIDSAGNQSIGVISDSIILDTAAPVTTISSATDGNNQTITSGGITKSNSISIAFNATDVNGVTGSVCKIDANSYSTCVSSKSYTALAEGNHTVSVRSTDNAGNVESAATFTFTVDLTAPNLTINSQTTTDTTPTVSGTTDDIADLSIIVNGKTYIAMPASGHWSVEIPGDDSLNDASYQILAMSIDSAGNKSAVAEGALVIDTAAPNLTLVPVGSNSSTITGTTNPDIGVSVTINDTTGDADVSEDGTWSFDVAPLADGSYPVSITATDELGNTANAETTLVIDTTAPVIIGLNNDTAPAKSKIWNWDSDDTTATYRFTIDQSSEWTPTGEYGDVKTATLSLGNGTYYLHVEAKDSVGNEGSVVSFSAVLDNTAPTVLKLGDESADVAIFVGDTSLVFSEILSDSSKTAVQNALTAGTIKTLTYAWSGDTLTIHASESATFANDAVVNVVDIAGNTATLLIIDSKLADTQTTPNSSTGVATADSITPQIVITNPTQAATVTINSGVTNPTIDVSSFITDGTGTIPQITITSNNADNVTIVIPTTTVTSADIAWNGVIAAPTVTTVTLPETSGETKTLSTAIELGFTGAKLSFNKAVRLLLPGQAGKRAGYVRTGTEFTEITTVCNIDDQEIVDAVLEIDGECKIDVGLDLVIWTKHFTTFATYTQTPTPTQTPSGGGGEGIRGEYLNGPLASPTPQPILTPAPSPSTTPTSSSIVTPNTTLSPKLKTLPKIARASPTLISTPMPATTQNQSAELTYRSSFLRATILGTVGQAITSTPGRFWSFVSKILRKIK